MSHLLIPENQKAAFGELLVAEPAATLRGRSR